MDPTAAYVKTVVNMAFAIVEWEEVDSAYVNLAGLVIIVSYVRGSAKHVLSVRMMEFALTTSVYVQVAGMASLARKLVPQVFTDLSVTLVLYVRRGFAKMVKQEVDFVCVIKAGSTE